MKISDSIDPHTLPTNKLKAFWALDQLETKKNSRFSASVIANYLIEECGIKTSRQAVQYALKTGKQSIHKNTKGYKLMEAGCQQLLNVQQNDEVIFIESGKPYSAKNKQLKKMFSSFTGTVCISDPYIDINTLDVIFKIIDKTISVRILTNKVIDRPKGILVRHLAELRKEGYQIKLGIYPHSDLHDRYISDNKSFWLSGNSLNCLGNKESFIVKLGEDVRQSMTATFNNRWKVSKKI